MANCLLDTHIFIWVTCNASKLPKSIAEILRSDNHIVYLSIASIWEIQIKHQLGKLTLTKPFNEIVDDVIQNKLYQILPIKECHVLNLQQLPFIHKDPFDRLLISQALTENLTLLTVDEHIVKYPISFINH